MAKTTSKAGQMMSFQIPPEEREIFLDLKKVIEQTTGYRISNSELIRVSIRVNLEKYITRLEEVVFSGNLSEEEKDAARKEFEALRSGELRLSELYEKVSKSGGIKE